MDIASIISIGQQAIYGALVISAPILIASFVVGILMSFLQAVFQIHEQTFSFVPKLVAIFAAMIIYGPWMLGEFVKLCHSFLGETYFLIQ